MIKEKQNKDGCLREKQGHNRQTKILYNVTF